VQVRNGRVLGSVYSFTELGFILFYFIQRGSLGKIGVRFFGGLDY
jgi:hypothetical protein